MPGRRKSWNSETAAARAGCTAAIYAARAMLEPILIGGIQPGGQLTITTEVENYPGFAQAIQGPWLMEQMQVQAEHVGTRLVSDTIIAADLARRPFTLVGDSGTRYSTQTLIIATGAQANWLGLKSERGLQGSFGVSACATCERLFLPRQARCGCRWWQYRGRGSIVPHQLRRSRHADPSPAIICARTRPISFVIAAHKKIEVIYNTAVAEVHGTSEPRGVTAITLHDVHSAATRKLDVDGLFVAIGHSPATDIFKGQLDMDDAGSLKTAPDSTKTSIAGVFAAGDVKDKIFRQAVTAAGMGCMAALEAERFLAEAH